MSIPARTLMVAATLLLAVMAAWPTWAGSTLERVRRTGVMTDVLLDSYPPFGFIDANNELDGFDVDVARAVAARLGVKLKLTTPAWEAIVSGHWQGRWDICICSMSPTRERAQVLDFPAIYYNSPAVLTVHRDERNIKSAADLSGKRVGVGIGSSYEKYLHQELVIPGAPPLTFPFHDVIVIPGDESINFRNLALGPGVRLDAIVSDLATAHTVSLSNPALRILSSVLYSEPNAIATEKGDPEWDHDVARIIEALKQDGTLVRISRKWFGADITTDGH